MGIVLAIDKIACVVMIKLYVHSFNFELANANLVHEVLFLSYGAIALVIS